MKRQAFILNFNNPKGCRVYLDDLCLDGKKITFIENAAGETIHFKDMSDEQVKVYARQIWELRQSKEGIKR